MHNFPVSKIKLFTQFRALQIILRVAAAIFGGYALTYTILATFAHLLSWPKTDVLFFCALLPPITYTIALIWAFAAPTARRAWQDLLAAALFFGILAFFATRAG